MDLFEQCVRNLVALETTGDSDLDRRVDYLVDTYLAGFGTETASMRMKLEHAFVTKAPMTRVRERIRVRIAREDLGPGTTGKGS